MEVKTLSFQQNGSLSIVQFLTAQQNTFEYISSSVGISKNLIEVREVSDSGSVNNLVVFNKSDHYVFFMDGDILAGAKQNRVLNTSLLLAPNTKTNIPVSCVEHGRWQRKSDMFKESDFISPSVLRAKKAKTVKDSLSRNQGFYASQGQVWDDVEKISYSLRVASPTGSLSDVFDDRKKDFDQFAAMFNINETANGIAVFINNKLQNIEVFNRTDIYSEYFIKILRGAAMEAFRLKHTEKLPDDKEAFYKTVTFLDKIETVKKDSHDSIGAGREDRFETEEMTGFELSYKEMLIHFASLNLQ